jgi:Tfp pilus assembly protein PilW
MNEKAKMNRRSGQSIIEAMIGISIITTGFLGIMVLLSKSFFYDRVITDQLTATYLSAEGVEIAKSFIDHDIASGAGWDACFSSYENSQGIAQVQMDYLTTSCDSIRTYSSAVPLSFNDATKEYGYTVGGTPTGFVRDIRITHAPAGNEITVESIVTWSTGPLTAQTVDLEDHFYHWRQ